MTGRVIVKLFGPVVRGVQTVTTETRYASLVDAVQAWDPDDAGADVDE